MVDGGNGARAASVFCTGLTLVVIGAEAGDGRLMAVLLLVLTRGVGSFCGWCHDTISQWTTTEIIMAAWTIASQPSFVDELDALLVPLALLLALELMIRVEACLLHVLNNVSNLHLDESKKSLS